MRDVKDLAEALESMSRHALRNMTVDEEQAVTQATAALRAMGEITAALIEAREVLALCTTRTFDAQPEDGIMRELGPRYGFGALMTAASKEWAAWGARNGVPAGSQHTCGPCEATVTSTLEQIDTALARVRGGKEKQ